MAAYRKINEQARLFTRPTTHIKIDDLKTLLNQCEEEDEPETVRYPTSIQESE
jgi:hypothetical protein